MTHVWVLAKTGYDEFTIVGVYSSEEKANEERLAVESAETEFGDRARLRHRRDDHYVVEQYELDARGFGFIVRARADGEVKETIVHVGYRSVRQNYEPTFEGRADTLDEAIALARAAIPPSSAVSETPNG